MPSQVDICNVAILDVGGNTINAIDEGSREAELCDHYWEMFVDEVLSEHTWNFAKQWVALAEEAGYSMVDSEYGYAYELPSDYVRMSRMEDKKSLYEVRGTTLLTNVEDCLIEYIKRVDDVMAFPPGFRMALIARLRAALAIPLARKGTKAIDWMNLYLSVDLPRAKTKDAMEGNQSEESLHQHTDENDTWLASRQ